MHHRKHLLPLLVSASLLGACAVDTVDDDGATDDVAQAASTISNVQWRVFPGLTGVAQLSLTHNQNGALALFARTSGGGIVVAQQTAPNSDWTGVISLGGWGLRDFAVAENADGRLEVFALGGDGAIYHQWQTAPASTAWSGWAYLGGHDLQDVAVARNADGRLVMLAVGADHYVYERRQVAANGGFGDWSWVGGPGVTRIAVGPYKSGRLTLLGLSPDGELMLTAQPTLNGNFTGWTTLDGWQLQHFELTRNADGRLEVAAIGGDANVYGKPQATPDLGWDPWFWISGGPVSDLDFASGAAGELHLFMIGSDHKVRHVAQNGPGAGYVAQDAMGGNDFVGITADHDLDGRIEVFAKRSDGTVYQTWQVQPGGHFWQLPQRPYINGVTVTPQAPHVGDQVSVSWWLNSAPGCTPYTKTSVGRNGSWTNVGYHEGETSSADSFTIQGDSTFRIVAGCTEAVISGTPFELQQDTSIHASAPLPSEVTTTYRQILPRDTIWDGAVTYAYDFGGNIWQGKLKGLRNPNLYDLSLIGPGSDGNDCWGSDSVHLTPGATASSADIEKLYDTSTPALPLTLRACASAGVNATEIDVTYSYVP